MEGINFYPLILNACCTTFLKLKIYIFIAINSGCHEKYNMYVIFYELK